MKKTSLSETSTERPKGKTMLTSTLPKTRGEAAALSRVRQMTDLVWTPLRDIPAYIGKEERYVVLEAGVPLKGILYSSTEDTDSFVEE